MNQVQVIKFLQVMRTIHLHRLFSRESLVQDRCILRALYVHMQVVSSSGPDQPNFIPHGQTIIHENQGFQSTNPVAFN